MAERCAECGHPVGWDQAAGECPRNMQNYQSDACKGRQVDDLRAKLTKLEAENARLRRYYVAQQFVFGADQESESFSRLCSELDAAKAELEKVKG